jgi:hypothetical protein
VTDITACASAQVEVAWTRLSCRVDGREVDLNDDGGQVRGGLFMGQPWFGTDAHDLMPLAFDLTDHAVVLRVGQRPDRVWHFWSPSPRAALALGKIEGCTVRARVRISAGAFVAGRRGVLARSRSVWLWVHRYRRPAILGICDGGGQDARPPSRSPC